MAGDYVLLRIAQRLEGERAALAEQLAAEKQSRKEAEENWANMSDALTACEAENARLVRQLVRWHSQLRTAVFVGCVGMNPDKTIRAVVAEMGRHKSAMGSTCGAAEATEKGEDDG